MVVLNRSAYSNNPSLKVENRHNVPLWCCVTVLETNLAQRKGVMRPAVRCIQKILDPRICVCMRAKSSKLNTVSINRRVKGVVRCANTEVACFEFGGPESRKLGIAVISIAVHTVVIC
jgi:hypothetical protein